MRQATSDKDYRQALQGLLYEQIRQGRDYSLFLPVTEIVEDETEQNLAGSSTNQIIPIQNIASKDGIVLADKQGSRANAFVSPQVQHALRTVDQAIAVLRRQSNWFALDVGIKSWSMKPSNVTQANSDADVFIDGSDQGVQLESHKGLYLGKNLF